MLNNDFKNDHNLINSLIADLLVYLDREKKALVDLNRVITGDTDYWINDDYDVMELYLRNFLANNRQVLSERFKPKGDVLIILSYNEPLILSVIPILNAIVAGNNIVVKPSSRNIDFINKVWFESRVVEKYNLPLTVLSKVEHEDLEGYIKSMNAVYFFGGYRVAQKIASVCAKYFVEFMPEIEAADCRVVKIENKDNFDIEAEVESLLYEAFSHSGQTCHRVHGVLVNKDCYDEYLDVLKHYFMDFCRSGLVDNCVRKEFKLDKGMYKQILEDINNSNCDEVIREKSFFPVLVANPSKESDFFKNAYFAPTVWITSFESEDDLLEILNNRRYFLGLNIKSDNNDFVKRVVDKTRFSRYTVRSSHIKVRDYEGWGGNWPSGFGGYKKWLLHFSNPYVEIGD